MRAIDKLNAAEPVSEPKSFSEGIVDKGYRDTPINFGTWVLDYFDYNDINDIGKLIWLMFDNNYLNDNDKLFKLLEAAKENGGRLSLLNLRKILLHSDNADINGFMSEYFMDDPFYDQFIPIVEMELETRIDRVKMDNFRFDHGNNNVNLNYLEWVLDTLGQANDRAPDYYAIVERLICFGEVPGWEDYYRLGKSRYNAMGPIVKKKVDGNLGW
jgi:hypothetical protein